MSQNFETGLKWFMGAVFAIGLYALGYVSCFQYYKLEQQKELTSIRKNFEANLDKELFQILNAQIRDLKVFTPKNPQKTGSINNNGVTQEVDIDYFESFTLYQGKCHFKFSNKNKHGDIKPHVRMAFYDKRGLCLGEASSIWFLSSIYAGSSTVEIEDSTFPLPLNRYK